MPNLFRLHRPPAASLRALSLTLSLLGALCLMPRLFAQSSDPPAKTETGKSDQDEKAKPVKPPVKKTPPPAPGNPLVLVNPQDGSGNSRDQFDSRGNRKSTKRSPNDRDYRRDEDDPRLGKSAKDLPLFGYNYFQWARRRIAAKNASLLRLYGVEPDPKTYSRLLRSQAKKNDRTDQERDSSREPDDSILTPYDDKNPKKKDAAKSKKRKNADTDDGLYSDKNLKKPGESDKEEKEKIPATEDERRTRDAQRRRKADETGQRDSTSRVMDNTEPTDSMDEEDTSPPRRTRRSVNSDDGTTTDDETDLNADTTDETAAERLARERRRRAQQQFDTYIKRSSGELPDTDMTDDTLTNSNKRTTRTGSTRTTDRTRDTQDELDTNPRRIRDEQTLPRTVNALNGEIADPLTQLYANVMATVPKNYQLSGGDRLTIRFSSKTLESREFARTVDAQGNLSLLDAGTLNVRGMTLEQAQIAIQSRLRRFYRGAEVTLNLSELRTITVTVTGEAFLPGSYTVPAVATAFNVLDAAGGPTRDGSLRSIEVQRMGKVIGTLDVYKLMTTGSQQDIPLQTGDQIYIPAADSHVALRGEVRRPALFEIKPNETLQDALKFAGGVKASGVDQFVQVNTLAPGTTRMMKNVNLKQPGVAAQTPLYDGDDVEIFSIRPYLANKVTVEGAVDQPSDYAMEPGMRVADLIQRARGPLSEAYLSRAELHRWNPDNTTTLIPIDLDRALTGDPTANIPLVRWDRLKVYARNEVAFTGYRKVTITGAMQNTGVFDLSKNTRVSDLLRMAGGPKPDAYMGRAVLLHQHGDGTFGYDYVNLTAAMQGDPTADVVVQDNDRLAVYRVGEAQFTPDHLVSIRGAVVTEGIYPRGEGMRLSQLLNLAGGFKPNAGTSVVVAHARKPVDAPESALKTVAIAFDAQRQTQNDVLLEDGDVVTVQGVGGFLDHVQVVNIKGAVNKPGPIVLTSKSMRLSDAIKEAGGLRPEAFSDGAEFLRDPKLLITAEQRSLTDTLSRLSNLLNDSKYKRELAKSDVERIKAAGSAADSGSLPLGIGGATPAANPVAGVLAAQLSQHDLVSKPRVFTGDDLEPNGNLAVNLTAALKRPQGADDILLADGDTITVPEKPTTVLVVGAVANGRGILFKPGANLDYYVTQAGGYAPDAEKKGIVVITAGVGLTPANKARELHPGDVIFVPTKPMAESIATRQNVLDSLVRSITSTALIFRLFGINF